MRLPTFARLVQGFLGCLPIAAMGMLALGCSGSAEDGSPEESTGASQDELQVGHDGCFAFYKDDSRTIDSIRRREQNGWVTKPGERRVYYLHLYFNSDGDHNNAEIRVKHPDGRTDSWKTDDDLYNYVDNTALRFHAEPGAMVAVKMIPDIHGQADPHCGLRISIR